MEFKDRVSAYPNRYAMTDENGNTSYVVLERADEPVVTGTPLNAETFNAAFGEKVTATESAEHPGCFYRMVGDVQEWLNPPMYEGEEYRTTEKWGGMPVFTKRIHVDSIPANETVDIEVCPSDAFVVGFDVYAYPVDRFFRKLPMLDSTTGELLALAQVNNGKIYIRTFADLSDFVYSAVVKYAVG